MKTLKQLEDELSPIAKHAFETYQYAFTAGDPNTTVNELRGMIKRLYGEKADQELSAHIEARCNAVIPQREDNYFGPG